MILSEVQTFEILYNSNKIYKAGFNHISFTTKVKWKCLSCMTDIYVSYKQFGRNAIFCPACYNLYVTKPTIVQYQYMRVLKEHQMHIVDKYLNNYTVKNIKN